MAVWAGRQGPGRGTRCLRQKFGTSTAYRICVMGEVLSSRQNLYERACLAFSSELPPPPPRRIEKLERPRQQGKPPPGQASETTRSIGRRRACSSCLCRDCDPAGTWCCGREARRCRKNSHSALNPVMALAHQRISKGTFAMTNILLFTMIAVSPLGILMLVLASLRSRIKSVV